MLDISKMFGWSSRTRNASSVRKRGWNMARSRGSNNSSRLSCGITITCGIEEYGDQFRFQCLPHLADMLRFSRAAVVSSLKAILSLVPYWQPPFDQIPFANQSWTINRWIRRTQQLGERENESDVIRCDKDELH